MRTYAFLDRDGTLVAERADDDWRGCRQLELLPGAGPALRALAEAGFALVVVTNQYPIGEGVVTADEYARQTDSLAAAVRAHGTELLDVLHCPHPRWERCRCAKPRLGLVDEAVRRHGPADRARSVVIGDRMTDLGLARAFGVRGYRVDSSATGGGPTFADVVSAVLRDRDPPPS